MDNLFVVSYDIMNPKRWHKVHRAMKGFGEPLQYSVFVCRLTDQNRVRMLSVLEDLIDSAVDRVMIVNLGPADGNAGDRVTFLGRKEEMPERKATII